MKLIKGNQYRVPNGSRMTIATYVGKKHRHTKYDDTYYLFQPIGSNHPGNTIGLASWRVENEVQELTPTAPKYTQLDMFLVELTA